MPVRPVLGLIAVAALMGACTTSQRTTGTATAVLALQQGFHFAADNDGDPSTQVALPNNATVTIGDSMTVQNVPNATGAAPFDGPLAFPTNFAAARAFSTSTTTAGFGTGRTGAAATYSSATPATTAQNPHPFVAGDNARDSGAFIANDLGSGAGFAIRAATNPASTAERLHYVAFTHVPTTGAGAYTIPVDQVLNYQGSFIGFATNTSLNAGGTAWNARQVQGQANLTATFNSGGASTVSGTVTALQSVAAVGASAANISAGITVEMSAMALDRATGRFTGGAGDVAVRDNLGAALPGGFTQATTNSAIGAFSGVAARAAVGTVNAAAANGADVRTVTGSFSVGR